MRRTVVVDFARFRRHGKRNGTLGMSRIQKALLVIPGIAVISFPLTFVLTFLLVPFWRWLEATYQIEAIGHSGPSEWCFWLVYALLILFLSLVAWRMVLRKRT